MPTLAETWYEQGFQKGLQRGIERGIEQGMSAERLTLLRQILVCQTSLRFDTETADALALLLQQSSKSEQLTQVGEWIIQCETGEDLLIRTRNLFASR